MSDSRLLPFRDYDEHDVINGLFSTVEGELSAGTLMSIASCDITKDAQEPISDTANLGSAAHFHSKRWIVPNKIQTATSGAMKTDVLGVAMYGVQEYDSL
jgi:hypothetical protein